MEAKAFKELLNRYREGKTSTAENARLESWYWQFDAAELPEQGLPGEFPESDLSGKLPERNVFSELSESDLLRARDSIAARLGLDINVLAQETASLESTEPGELTKSRKLKLWRNAGAVAAAVATIVFGVWLYKIASQARNDGSGRNHGLIANDVAPGKYGATITLANGEVIELDSAKRGVVVEGAAGAVALRYEDGAEIASEAAQPRNDGKGGYNGKGGNDDQPNPSLREGTTKQSLTMLTATTAKGQTYSFTLPDGTKVWLNADSKLEFPAQFSGKERRILMQGEAYFVVKHNAKQPFRVVSRTGSGREQMVEDIGTEFNINAYADERSVRTTLVEGSAAVSSLLSGSSLRGGTTRQSPLHDEIASKAAHSRNDGNAALEMTGKRNDSNAAIEMMTKSKGIVLTPNQQAAFLDGQIKVKKVDVNEAIGWKNGKFTFNNTSLEEVLRQLGRWYDVDIVYPDGIPDRQFTGEIYRNLNASEALELLKFTKVSFKIAGKQIIVNK